MKSNERHPKKWILAAAATELLPLLLTFGASANLAHADPTPIELALQRARAARAAAEAGQQGSHAEVPAPGEAPAPAEVPAPSGVVANSGPTPTQPAPEPAIPRIEARDQELSMAELSNFPGGVRLEKKGIDPGSEVVLRGMIYEACADKFEITNTSQDPLIGSNGKAGFRVVDLGGAGSACIKALKAQGLRCNVNGGVKCIPLSEKEGARLKMNSLGDVEIGILSRNSGEDIDSDNAKFDPAVPAPIKHLSAATIAAQAAEKKRLAREAEIERNKRIFKACRKDDDQLAQARNALDALAQLTGMSPAEFDKMGKELKKAELAILKKKVAKAKLSNDAELDELREELEQYAEENPDESESIAQMFMDLSQRIATQKGATPATFAKAKEMAQAGRGLPDVSDTMAARLDAYQNTISIASLTSTLQYGSYDPFTFMPAYQSIMRSTYNDMRASCRSMSAGSVSDSCSLARQNYTEAAKLPQVAMQSYQQEVSLQQQMQQQMYQMMMQQNQMMMQGMSGGMPTLGANQGNTGLPANANLGTQNPQAGMMQVGGGLNAGLNTGVRPFAF